MLQGRVPAGCLAVDDKEGRKRLGGCSRTSWLRHCGEGAGGNSREGNAGLLTGLLWGLPFTADAWQGRKHLRIC